MKKFMLDIRLEALDNETRMRLLPEEQAIVKEMEQKKIIINLIFLKILLQI